MPIAKSHRWTKHYSNPDQHCLLERCDPRHHSLAPPNQQSMLQPLSYTNHRLNSCIPHNPPKQKPTVKPSISRKTVTFDKEGDPPCFVSSCSVSLSKGWLCFQL